MRPVVRPGLRLRRIGLERLEEVSASEVAPWLERLFQPLQYSATQLREHRFIKTPIVDIERMVSLTLIGRPQVELSYRFKRVLPRLVFLIQRLGDGDHFSAVAEATGQAFLRAGVLLDMYFFGSEPTLLSPIRQRNKRITLDDLCRTQPNDRLAVFADTKSFFSAATGRLAPWVEALRAWSEYAVVTTSPQDRWAYREATVAAEGFLVVPFSATGLEALIDHWTREDDRTRSRGVVHGGVAHAERPVPPELLRDDDAGSQMGRVSLLDAVRDYFGVQALFVQALAVYPQMHWRLTLMIAAAMERCALVAPMTLDEALSLCRLPFFRQGHFDEPSRLELVSALTVQEAAEVREVLLKVFGRLADGSPLEEPEGLPPRSLHSEISAVVSRLRELLQRAWPP